MKERRVLKKGKIVVTRQGNVVINLANKIVKTIKPFCSRIEIMGSIRRKEKNPVDVDIAVIPKNKEKLEEFMKSKKWNFLEGGEKKSSWKIEGVKVELYYTNKEEWGAMLLAYSSEFGAGIGLRMIAKKKGLKLNQHGLFTFAGKRIAGKTEQEIYHALGREWKAPENR